MVTELLVLGLIVFLVYNLVFCFKKPNSLDLLPGPKPLPLIGNIHLLSKEVYLSFTELGKKYGRVFRIYIGKAPIVVLNGEAIREALVRKSSDTASRPLNSFARSINSALRGTPWPALQDYGPCWRLYRKLGHSAIRLYGQNRLEDVIQQESDDLCKRLAKSEGVALDVSKEVALSTTNVICTKIFGSRYDITDPEFLKLCSLQDGILRLLVPEPSIADLFPFLRSVLPMPKNSKLLQNLNDQMLILLKKHFTAHENTYTEGRIRDYADAILKVKRDAEEEDKTAKEWLQENYILMFLAGLFLGGSETTSTSISWAVLYLVRYPDVQDRLQREMDDVIGRDEIPSLSLKKELPLLEAFMAETLRLSSILPLAIPHRNTEDITLGGYHIPKGTTLFTNLWSLHHDPSYWKDPFQFNIDRFLDEEGKFSAPSADSFLPFGAGVRMCMGEVLARVELFLFLCRLLQQFRFENPLGCELPSLKAEVGGVLHPKPYQVCVKKRF